MSDVLEESKMQTGKNAKSQKERKKKVLLKDNRVPIHNARGKFSPPLDGHLRRQRTTTILQDSDNFRISKPYDMNKATLLSLRGSLGRKPRRATQAKVRAREKYKKKEQKKKRKKKGKKKKKKEKKRMKKNEK